MRNWDLKTPDKYKDKDSKCQSPLNSIKFKVYSVFSCFGIHFFVNGVTFLNIFCSIVFFETNLIYSEKSESIIETYNSGEFEFK